MMTPEELIFTEALTREPADARDAYLQEACAADEILRQAVAALLKAHATATGILDAPLDLPEAQDLGVDAPATSIPGVGSHIGPYHLLEQLGDGGMGVVYRAEQLRPVRRQVALKVIKPGMDSGQVIARFEAERQVLTMMDHPNIAKVLDAGTTDNGHPYFVMELVPGMTITDYCDQARLTIRQRLELFIPVCHAVQHAHQKGIIHRDLKPSNVLVTLHDDKPVPKVIDFGIAKAAGHILTERTLFNSYFQMVGTPLYMSPEQAQISGLDVDTRSDVYSLGALLYELLTGTTPFDHGRLHEATYDEMRRIIREVDPPRPSARLTTTEARIDAVAERRHANPKTLRQVISGELDWIVMKAMDKERARRYDSANELARDLERFLRDEPVHACPPTAWYRFRKLARRHQAAIVITSALAACVLLAMVAMGVSATLVWRANADLSQSLERERRESYFQRITVAHRELSSADNLRGALRILGECPPDLRTWEWHYLMRLCRVEPLVINDSREVTSISFSPDGERLASAGADGVIKIRNSRSGEVLQSIDAHQGWAFSVAFHPDGQHVASVGADRRLRVWELTGGAEVFSGVCDVVHMFGAAYAVAFSPDGSQVTAGGDGALRVWEWRTGRLLHDLPNGEQRAPTVAFSKDGRWLASGTWRGSLRMWDAEAGGRPLRNFVEDQYPITALAFSPDGGRLAQAGFGRRVKVWDTATGALGHSLEHTGLVACVAFSPDGRYLASGGEDKTVRVWDATAGREVLGLRGHTGACLCVAFSPDGYRLASAGTDGAIRIWNATPLQGDEAQEMQSFSPHHNEVWRLAVSPDGRQIASGGFKMPVEVWDASTGEIACNYSGQHYVCFDLAWHPKLRQIASSGWDGKQFTVKQWNSDTGQEIFSIGAATEFFAVAFSPDGAYLVTGGMGRAIQIWYTETGREVATLGTHSREIRGLAFSSDGRNLASASDGQVKLWDATRLTEHQQPRHILHGRVPGQCLNIAFSPDGRRILVGGDENTVVIWDVESGSKLTTLRGHSREVYTAAFSPGDGRWVASAGEDSTVRIWDSHSGTMVRTFRGHEALVSSVAFGADGRLFSGSRDHSVKVWDLGQLVGASSLPSPK